MTITVKPARDIPVVEAMTQAWRYWLEHKDEIAHFSFNDWCKDQYGFTWTGDPGKGTFKFEVSDRQKYTEFMLVWQ